MRQKKMFFIVLACFAASLFLGSQGFSKDKEDQSFLDGMKQAGKELKEVPGELKEGFKTTGKDMKKAGKEIKKDVKEESKEIADGSKKNFKETKKESKSLWKKFKNKLGFDD
ncbi:MAG: hypothetical protein KKE17_08310 [Proteobacteria bacterium]|nr:hypothetical protein [Pseudomonadota bacterium]MBU1709990.1 hypothetical protein [Pseudomonadota bacterium]